jgi:uncharacterized membrane protein
VSFFVIGAIWVHHHSLFKPVAIVDRPLMALNLLLLLCVIVFPFPTAPSLPTCDTAAATRT